MNSLCMTSALSHGIVVSRIITQSVSDWPWNWHMYAIILLGHLLHYDCAGSIAVVPLLPCCVTTALVGCMLAEWQGMEGMLGV